MSIEIETVVIGAEQAGLALSYHLAKAGRSHMVLGKASRLANARRNQRWNSFTLVTPDFQVRMPGAEYEGPEPYGFMRLAQIVEYLDTYARRYLQLKPTAGVLSATPL